MREKREFINSGEEARVVVQCNEGEIAVSGGGRVGTPGDTIDGDALTESVPANSQGSPAVGRTPVGWIA